MVAEVGHYVVHDVNQQRDDLLLLVAVEHHVQQVSQHLPKETTTVTMGRTSWKKQMKPRRTD